MGCIMASQINHYISEGKFGERAIIRLTAVTKSPSPLQNKV